MPIKLFVMSILAFLSACKIIGDFTVCNYKSSSNLAMDSEPPSEEYQHFTAIDDAGLSPVLGLVLRETLCVY